MLGAEQWAHFYIIVSYLKYQQNNDWKNALRRLFESDSLMGDESNVNSDKILHKNYRSAFVFLARGVEHGKNKFNGKRCIGVAPHVPIQLIQENICDLVIVEADG